MFKKLVAIMLAVSLLGIFSIASAASVSLGVETDFTINRDVEGDGIDSASYSAQHYDVVADIAVNDSLTISPKVGFTKMKLSEDSSSDELSSELGTNFGADAKWNLYKGDVNIDLSGKYRYSQVKFKDSIKIPAGYYYINYEGKIYMGPSDYDYTIKGKLHEYEIGPIVSKSFGEDTIITPYLGIVYSQIDGKLTTEGETIKVEAKDNIGLRLGTSVKLTNNINLFIDGALVDKQGVSAKVTYLF